MWGGGKQKTSLKALYRQVSLITNNQTVLYLFVAISFIAIICFLAAGRPSMVILFSLVALISAQFTSNMILILSASLMTCFLFMLHGATCEGMENKIDEEKDEKKDDDLDKKLDRLRKTRAAAKVHDQLAQDPSASTETAAEVDDASTTTVETVPDAFVSANAALVSRSGNGGVQPSPRVDYAKTLEESYKYLDKILDSDGIHKLTDDTQKLMSQQQKLFDFITSMTPMLQDAQNMLGKFDMKSLGKIAGLTEVA